MCLELLEIQRCSFEQFSAGMVSCMIMSHLSFWARNCTSVLCLAFAEMLFLSRHLSRLTIPCGWGFPHRENSFLFHISESYSTPHYGFLSVLFEICSAPLH
jgi:hypothetical protein